MHFKLCCFKFIYDQWSMFVIIIICLKLKWFKKIIKLYYDYKFITINYIPILFQDNCHNDWVSSVCLPPSISNPIIISGGWDKIVKVWDLSNCRIKNNYYGHNGYINTVTVSPDGSLCASGGKVRIYFIS